MRIHEILNYNGNQRAFRSIANAFAPNGMLKFPLDLEAMRKVAGPVHDQTTVPVSNPSMTSPSDNTVPPMMTGNSAPNLSAIPISLPRRPGASNGLSRGGGFNAHRVGGWKFDPGTLERPS
jgi:hypothetical protein